MTLIERINALATRIGTEIKNIPVKLAANTVTVGIDTTVKTVIKGKVGIFDNDPSMSLSVQDDSTGYMTQFVQNNVLGKGVFIWNSGNADIDSLLVSSAAGRDFVVKSNGLVGIGTYSPSNSLTIGGAAAKAINRDRTDGSIDIYGGTDYLNGAYFKLTGSTHNSGAGNSTGEFTIGQATGTYASRFVVNSFNGTAWTARFAILGASGRVGIGQYTPTAFLHLRAGLTSASSAPLKFASGSFNTTPEVGAMEYNGTNLSFVRTTSVREIIPTVLTKTTTGDATGAEGLLQINTFDKTLKIYANAEWRTLITW